MKKKLEKLYLRFNHKSWVHPDPLEFLYAFGTVRDREIAGLIASSLAYGRVAQILVSAASILDRMSSSEGYGAAGTTSREGSQFKVVTPLYDFVMNSNRKLLRQTFKGFKHRFTTTEDLVDLLLAIHRIVNQYGSIEACFADGLDEDAPNIIPAMEKFVDALDLRREKGRFSLIPHPKRKSACKRMNLYLRWMVRRDRVDPGGWTAVKPSQLVIPLDTHMHRIALKLGLTQRKQPDLQCALQITDAFRKIRPEDPTRYDFALTRLGIHPELTY